MKYLEVRDFKESPNKQTNKIATSCEQSFVFIFSIVKIQILSKPDC